MPAEEWRERYRGWKALEKLEYVDALMGEARKKAPLVVDGSPGAVGPTRRS